MYTVTGTTITMTRGDSVRIDLRIKNADGTDYTPDANDKIRFTVKKNYDGENLIHKFIRPDDLALYIEPEDTENLPYGYYVYDVELTDTDGIVDTIIRKARLNISEEVTQWKQL